MELYESFAWKFGLFDVVANWSVDLVTDFK
jgi:hypothetical protein